MKINFYVLQSDLSNDNAKLTSDATQTVLNFVCRLTQTVLAKSSHSMVIVDDDDARLNALDELLWTFDATSFIPHERVTSDFVTDSVASSIAPVLLTESMPESFDGVVLNLSAKPIALDSTHALPNKVLEIIAFDDVSKQQGRDKYRHYKQLGLDLSYHQV